MNRALKVIYLSIQSASARWTRPIQNWKSALNRLSSNMKNALPRIFKRVFTQNYLQAQGKGRPFSFGIRLKYLHSEFNPLPGKISCLSITVIVVGPHIRFTALAHEAADTLFNTLFAFNARICKYRIKRKRNLATLALGSSLHLTRSDHSNLRV